MVSEVGTAVVVKRFRAAGGSVAVIVGGSVPVAT